MEKLNDFTNCKEQKGKSAMFEKIVASLKWCKKIPENEFTDSTFVWLFDAVKAGKYRPECREDDQYFVVKERTDLFRNQEGSVYPAPTLEEVYENFPEELRNEPLSIERNYWVEVKGESSRAIPFADGEKLTDCILQLWEYHYWLLEQDRIWNEMQLADWLRHNTIKRESRKKENA